MLATIIIVAAFKNSTQLTNAYGFAVATVMFTTTVLIALQIRYVKHLHIIVAILFFCCFGFFDGEKTSPAVTLCAPALTSYQVSSGAPL
jgi:KUP system potassium uptake protein